MKIIDRIVFNEKLRKELAAVKKEAKEKQKKISFKIPKLRDCKYHYQRQVGRRRENDDLPDGRGICSAPRSSSSRDPLTQAVFSLRGKPLNVHGMKMDQLYKNEEMFNLMSAL